MINATETGTSGWSGLLDQFHPEAGFANALRPTGASAPGQAAVVMLDEGSNRQGGTGAYAAVASAGLAARRGLPYPGSPDLTVSQLVDLVALPEPARLVGAGIPLSEFIDLRAVPAPTRAELRSFLNGLHDHAPEFRAAIGDAQRDVAGRGGRSISVLENAEVAHAEWHPRTNAIHVRDINLPAPHLGDFVLTEICNASNQGRFYEIQLAATSGRYEAEAVATRQANPRLGSISDLPATLYALHKEVIEFHSDVRFNVIARQASDSGMLIEGSLYKNYTHHRPGGDWAYSWNSVRDFLMTPAGIRHFIAYMQQYRSLVARR